MARVLHAAYAIAFMLLEGYPVMGPYLRAHMISWGIGHHVGFADSEQVYVVLVKGVYIMIYSLATSSH